MKIFRWLAVFASIMLLDGCYTPLVEGAQEAYDAGRRDALRAGATAGDPVAQYELGDSYCCRSGGPLNNVTIYDNHKATHWYCKAAHKGYAPAQLRLARLYSGHPIHGFHIALRASALLGNAETDLGIALLWANIAANHGAGDAPALRDEIVALATDKERARAATLLQDWRAAPCEWAAVFPAARNKG